MSRLTPLVVLVVITQSAAAADFVKIEEKDGKLVALITLTKYQQVNKAVTVNEKGVPVTKTVTELVPVSETAYHVLDAAAGEWFTPTGEKLDPKKLGDVLKKGSVLVVSHDGKPLDKETANKYPNLAALLVPKGAVVAKADPPKDLSTEKPFAATASVTDGAVGFVRDAVVMQTVQRQETRGLPGGKMEVVTVNVQVPITKREVVALDPKRTQVLRLDGTTVPPADWADVFKGGVKVLVSPGGKEIPDELRAAHKDAVVVVVIKAAKK